MSRLNQAVLKTKTYAKEMKNSVREKLFSKRSGEAGVIVAAVLLVIAVVLLLTFKEAITGWLGSINTNIGTKIGEFTK